MFIAALFITAKIVKQLKWPSTDEWIKRMVYIYDEILFSLKKGKSYHFNNMVRVYHAK